MISYYRDINNGTLIMAGLSTDTKPTADIENGAIYIEMDTSKAFYFNAASSEYVEKGSAASAGVLIVTENGDFSVVGYATAIVNVGGISGEITIIENGEYDVETYESALVSIPQPSGTISITEQGTYDVTSFVSANVNVSVEEKPLDDVIARTATSIEDSAITYLGENALAMFSALVSFSATNCSMVSADAFWRCEALSAVYMPNVETLGYNAFAMCSALSSINLPKVKIIGQRAFDNCTALQSVDFSVCESVGMYAFTNCTNLTTVSLPACKIVDGSAFQTCPALQEITLDSAQSINNGAFSSCTGLTMVSLPMASNIVNYAFNKCYNLISLYLMGSSVCKLGNSNAFSSTPIGGYSTSAGKYGSVYVPSSLLSNYKTAAGWSTIQARLVGV